MTSSLFLRSRCHLRRDLLGRRCKLESRGLSRAVGTRGDVEPSHSPGHGWGTGFFPEHPGCSAGTELSQVSGPLLGEPRLVLALGAPALVTAGAQWLRPVGTQDGTAQICLEESARSGRNKEQGPGARTGSGLYGGAWARLAAASQGHMPTFWADRESGGRLGQACSSGLGSLCCPQVQRA